MSLGYRKTGDSEIEILRRGAEGIKSLNSRSVRWYMENEERIDNWLQSENLSKAQINTRKAVLLVLLWSSDQNLGISYADLMGLSDFAGKEILDVREALSSMRFFVNKHFGKNVWRSTPLEKANKENSYSLDTGFVTPLNFVERLESQSSNMQTLLKLYGKHLSIIDYDVLQVLAISDNIDGCEVSDIHDLLKTRYDFQDVFRAVKSLRKALSVISTNGAKLSLQSSNTRPPKYRLEIEA